MFASSKTLQDASMFPQVLTYCATPLCLASAYSVNLYLSSARLFLAVGDLVGLANASYASIRTPVIDVQKSPEPYIIIDEDYQKVFLRQ